MATSRFVISTTGRNPFLSKFTNRFLSRAFFEMTRRLDFYFPKKHAAQYGYTCRIVQAATIVPGNFVVIKTITK